MTLEEDFDVFGASGADEGLAILEREQLSSGIRIVLCDQRMPGTTGVQFLTEVRSRWPDIVRIILYGYTDAEDIISGVNEAGIWQYLLKPWQPEQLLLTLQRAAEVWRLQQENQRLSLDLRTAEPVLKRHVVSKQEKAKSSFGLSAVIRAPGSAGLAAAARAAVAELDAAQPAADVRPMTSLLGRSLGVKRVITRVGRPANRRLFERVGIDVALSARGAAVGSIVHQIQGGRAHLLAVLEEGQATIVEIEVPPGFRPRALMEMRPPPKSIVGAILRGNDVLIPRGPDQIRPQDRLVVFAAADSVAAVRDYFGTP